jgi:hypothetical protein
LFQQSPLALYLQEKKQLSQLPKVGRLSGILLEGKKSFGTPTPAWKEQAVRQVFVSYIRLSDSGYKYWVVWTTPGHQVFQFFIMKFFTFVGLSALIVSITSAAVPSSTPISGKTINVTTQSLCIFMPKTPGESIASSEPTAVAFCNNTSAAPGAKKIPAGFIKSSHFVSGTGQGKYVQYTGTIDPTKYSLKSKDGGGQYDNHVSIIQSDV